MSPTRLTITNHAWKRIGQMGLTKEEVLAAVRCPDADYPALGGRRIAQRGDVAVCYEPAEGVVVTVLPRTPDEYLRPEKQRLRWRTTPERVIDAVISAEATAEAGAAALRYFGLDATAVVLDSGRRLVHLATLDQLIDIETGRRSPVPDQLYLEEPFELEGEVCRYVPAWPFVDDAAVAEVVEAMRARLEQEDSPLAAA